MFPSRLLRLKPALFFRTHSLSTPAKPLKTSPTPIPSLPTCSFPSFSRSSNLLAAVPNTRLATRSAVFRYCSILCNPSAKRSILGSKVAESWERCECSAEVVVKVNGMAVVDGCDGGSRGCDWDCRVERMEACVGSRREASISEREGGGCGCVEGGGCAARVENEDMASQAAFSSSRLGCH